MKKAIGSALFSIIFLSYLTANTIQNSGVNADDPETQCVKAYFKALKEDNKEVLGNLALSPRIIDYQTFVVISVAGPVIDEFGLTMLLRERLDLSKKRKSLIFDALDKLDEVESLRDKAAETTNLAEKEELERKMARYDREAEELKGQIKSIQNNLNEVKRCIETEKQIFYASIGKAASGKLDEFLEQYRIDEVKHELRVRVKTAMGDIGEYVFLLRRILLKTREDQIVRRGGLVIADILDI